MLERLRKFRAIRQRRHQAAYGVCHCRFADFLAEKVAQSGALRQICVIFIRKSLSESRYLVDVNTFLVILPWGGGGQADHCSTYRSPAAQLPGRARQDTPHEAASRLVRVILPRTGRRGQAEGGRIRALPAASTRTAGRVSAGVRVGGCGEMPWTHPLPVGCPSGPGRTLETAGACYASSRALPPPAVRGHGRLESGRPNFDGADTGIDLVAEEHYVSTLR